MEDPAAPATEQILGIQFFDGSVAEAVAQGIDAGGLVVAPSGTCFERFVEDQEYRRAILTADLALPDSGAMVALWGLLTGRPLNRISGLAYIQRFLSTLAARKVSDVFWILPHQRAREKLLAWSAANNPPSAIRHPHFLIDPAACYLAPHYGPSVTDPALLALIATRRPRHLIIAIGAGAQEKLGWYLREHLPGRPGIHCIGGALGFITGDQNPIPEWADRLYLGWFLRFLSQPRAFLPRLWKARVLLELLKRDAERLKRGDAGRAEVI